MFKFVVLSVLVFGCSALPALQYGGSSSGYGSGSSYGSGASLGSSFVVGVPQKVSVIGLQGAGYGSGYGASSGLSTGYSGVSSGLSSGYGAGFGVSSGLGLGVQQQGGLAVNTIGLQQQQSGLSAQNHFGLLHVRQGQQFEQVVPAAIQQIARTVEYRPFAIQEQPIQAQVVEIEPSDNPVHLHFKTRSSSLSVSQSHQAAQAAEVQTAAAQDEPQRLLTEVQKPVIQEVREVISPYRQVTQEINPVVESLHTIVTKGEGHRAQYQGANFGAQYGSQYQHGSQFQTGAIPVSHAASQIVRPIASASYQAVQAAPLTISTQFNRQQQSAGFIPASNSGSSSFQSSTYSAPAIQSGGSFQSSSFQTKPLVAKVQSSFSSNTASSSSDNGY